METGKIQFITAKDMETAIVDTGKVAIYGILFDFDKAVIKPEFQADPRRDRAAARSRARS